jgi:hypothetical protein
MRPEAGVGGNVNARVSTAFDRRHKKPVYKSTHGRVVFEALRQMMQMQMQMHCKWRANSARAAWRRAKQTRTRSKPPLDWQCETSKIADYLHILVTGLWGCDDEVRSW